MAVERLNRYQRANARVYQAEDGGWRIGYSTRKSEREQGGEQRFLPDRFDTSRDAYRFLDELRGPARETAKGGGNQEARRAWARLATGRW